MMTVVAGVREAAGRLTAVLRWDVHAPVRDHNCSIADGGESTRCTGQQAVVVLW